MTTNKKEALSHSHKRSPLKFGNYLFFTRCLSLSLPIPYPEKQCFTIVYHRLRNYLQVLNIYQQFTFFLYRGPAGWTGDQLSGSHQPVIRKDDHLMAEVALNWFPELDRQSFTLGQRHAYPCLPGATL